MIRQINSKDAHIVELIEALGDIAIKAAKDDKNNITKHCINKLKEIAIEFLELKSNNEEQYKVEDALFAIQESPNQFVKYVSIELIRIFNTSINHENEADRTNLIYSFLDILIKTLESSNNDNIIRVLTETRSNRGSKYVELLNIVQEKGTQSDKDLLTRHLGSIVYYSINGGIKLSYLNDFFDYHFLRILQIIIDKNDYITFKNFIDMLSKYSIMDPMVISTKLEQYVAAISSNTQDGKINNMIKEICFLITNNCLRDFEKIEQVRKKIIDLEDLIIKQSKSYEVSEIETKICNIKNELNKFYNIKNELNKFYICSKLYGAIFKIGSYIISKDKNYIKYINGLWHYKETDDDNTIYVNETPTSKSLQWNTLFVIYSGNPKIYHVEIFDDFNYSKYSYEYYALILLQYNKPIYLPSRKVISENIKNHEEYKNLYYFDYATKLDIEKIQDALDRINVKEKISLVLRLPDDVNLEDRIKDVQKKLNKLKKMREETIDSYIILSKINDRKIEEFKQKSIIGNYKESTQLHYIAEVHDDENLQESSCEVMMGRTSEQRERFIDQDSIPYSDLPYDSPLVTIENRKIQNKIINNIQSNEKYTTNAFQQICNAVDTLKANGFVPNVIFLNSITYFELLSQNTKIIVSENKLKINSEIELQIRYYEHNELKDIIIFDSTQLSVTFKAKDSSNRFKIQDTDLAEKKIVNFSIKSLVIIKINKKGFIRIINKN